LHYLEAVLYGAGMSKGPVIVLQSKLQGDLCFCFSLVIVQIFLLVYHFQEMVDDDKDGEIPHPVEVSEDWL
jgi:hypothetical protein